nr:IS110 family transposase [Pseudofrankia saprophytica]
MSVARLVRAALSVEVMVKGRLAPTMAQQTDEVTGGVDTHKDSHTAAALDSAGRLLGVEQFPATGAGYGRLLDWLRGFGAVGKVGVEGTGVYGAGLARHLAAAGVAVVEIDRPDRKARRWQGKSDPVDAEAAARAALAGRRTGKPKDRTGQVEALRALQVARRGAVEGRADAQRQMKALVVTAPEQVRAELSALTATRLVEVCASADIAVAHAGDPAVAVRLALRSLARRHQRLSVEIRDLDTVINRLVVTISPKLLEVQGVGPDTAGQMLVTMGANPDRMRSEAAFAMLCGVAPLPASSGRTHRYRLNRGGDRQANAALYRVVLSRLRWDARTRAYVERRTKEGKSKKEIIRCLKRYVARELYAILTTLREPNDLPVIT